MWSSGDTVVLRELWDGRIWKARAWTVVKDEPDELVLWIQSGAETRIPDAEEAVPPAHWELVPSTFRRRALRLTRPGVVDSTEAPKSGGAGSAGAGAGEAHHSRLLFFGDDGALQGWYVNFERPLERSAVGFDYVDLLLDLWIAPDGRHRLVDEEELDQAVAQGLIAPSEAAAVRAEAEHVLAEHAFPTGWEEYRPDPEWRPPRLPAGWDEVGGPERR